MLAAGGVVGGLAALCVVALVAFFLMRQQRNKAAYRSHADADPRGQQGWPAADELEGVRQGCMQLPLSCEF